jgi:hypothetical protein
MNHEKNVTIRMKIPDSMKMVHHIQVHYDQEHHILSIHGSHREHHGHPENTMPDSSDGTSTSSSSTSKSHVEFTQSFAMDPNVVDLDHIIAQLDDHGVVTVMVPKFNVPPIGKHHHIRSIPVWTAAEAPAGGTTTIMASSHEPVLAQH